MAAREHWLRVLFYLAAVASWCLVSSMLAPSAVAFLNEKTERHTVVPFGLFELSVDAPKS